MTFKKQITLTAATLALFFAPESSEALEVGVVNFKMCVENSKIGKQEQTNFESMKKQMEKTLEDKEKAINELATKFNDPEYLDSLSQDAESELKHKFRTLSQELNQLQGQFYQLMQQANMKIVQQLSEKIGEASSKVARAKNLDVVVNEESVFYFNDKLDISNDVVKELDVMFSSQAK